MDLHTLQQEIIQEEGGIILKPYKDHLGYWTIGAGHLIRDNEKDELMQPITYQRGLELFLKDFNVSKKDMETFTEGMNIDDNAKECVLHMVFQLGLPRLNKFVKFKKCLSENDIPGAMLEMKDSLWYRQTTNRANRIIKKMEQSQKLDV
jgi:GH24 family phage-related lysozyme (muramidase)